jgi:Tfp pilus assembly protein PilV
MMEILMALFILVIVIMAVSRTQTNARRVQQGAYHVEQASAYAQGKMDDLAAASLRSVAPGRDTVRTPMGLAFVRSWTAVDRGASKEVEVTVTWPNGGRIHAVRIGSLVR